MKFESEMNAKILGGRASTRSGAGATQRNGERGQSFIEMVLMLPVLLLVLIGLIELGRYAYYDIEVANASKAGAQFASQSLAIAAESVSTPGTTLLVAEQADVPDLAGSLTANATQSCTCPGAGSTAGVCNVGAPPACGYPQVFVSVTSQFTMYPLFNYPGISTLFPVTITATDTSPVQIQ